MDPIVTFAMGLGFGSMLVSFGRAYGAAFVVAIQIGLFVWSWVR
jgi:hypothetical protein